MESLYDVKNLALAGVFEDLCNASFDSLEGAMVQCSSTLMEQWESFKQSESMKRLKTSPTQGVRLSKIKSACDHFSEAVHSCAEEFLEAYEKYVARKGRIAAMNHQQNEFASQPFPSCIEKNVEAYFQGTWRKKPYEHRFVLSCRHSRSRLYPMQSIKHLCIEVAVHVGYAYLHRLSMLI